jgi:hypothetical protein
VYAQCVLLGMPRSRSIALEGRLMDCCHGLPLHCYSLARISEILVGADILLMPIFVTVSAWRAGTTRRYSAGESPPLKAGRPEAMPHLASACGGLNTFWETGNLQRGLGEVSCCGLCRAKQFRLLVSC